MGANMVRRLIKGGHHCVVYDRSVEAVKSLAAEGATGAESLADLVKKLQAPRAIWLMVPAAVVDHSIAELVPLLERGDIVIDGGNSYYVDDIRRAGELAPKGLHYVDVGTSGGVWGLERGYCMMIGGEKDIMGHLDPIFATLAPGIGDIPRTPGRESLGGTSEQGYLHCGSNGAGHFVKMVHNGIEYGIMAAYAEGLGVLRAANAGKRTTDTDAWRPPHCGLEHYQYDLQLGDCRGLAPRQCHRLLVARPDSHGVGQGRGPEGVCGRVSDSGEGRWTIKAAIDEGVPVPVLTTALYERFASRGEVVTIKTRSCPRCGFGFGGHLEKSAK